MQRGMYEKGNLMIEILDGIREIANFKEGMHLCLYDNDNVEDYPPHWHAPIEIIMPIENTYRAVCDNVEYMIYPETVFNNFVIESTVFKTWDEMVMKAADERFPKEK